MSNKLTSEDLKALRKFTKEEKEQGNLTDDWAKFRTEVKNLKSYEDNDDERLFN